ncbi:MAG: hypothetical protein ACRDD8_16330 [Bacteroidales bacterium]
MSENEELQKKVDELTKEVQELKTYILMLIEKPNVPTAINYNIMMEMAIFNYIIYDMLDRLTGKNNTPVTQQI